MKKTLSLFSFACLFGCGSPSGVTLTINKMPATETAFTKKLSSQDSIYNAQINDITKKESLEKSKGEVTKFILENRKVDNWVAIIHDIEVNTQPTEYIKLDLFIPEGDWKAEKYPQYSFPVLESLIDSKSGKIKDALKVLQKGDEVLISGEIQKNLSGGINIESFGAEMSDITPFNNLKLDFVITDIKKSTLKLTNQ